MKHEHQRVPGRSPKEQIRGDADAEVIRIAAEAYSKSPEFYEFLRRLEAVLIADEESSAVAPGEGQMGNVG